jgi:heme/copper-type cytochrome/quinol oxidase subunit 2
MVNRFVDAIFWIAVACCVVAQAAIVRSSLVSPARTPSLDEGGGTSVGRRALEVCWAVIPGIALALLFLATWRAMHGATPSAILDVMSTTR